MIALGFTVLPAIAINGVPVVFGTPSREWLLETIRMFQAFSRYLSNVCDSSHSGNDASRNSSQADSSDPEPTEIGHGFA